MLHVGQRSERELARATSCQFGQRLDCHNDGGLWASLVTNNPKEYRHLDNFRLFLRAAEVRV